MKSRTIIPLLVGLAVGIVAIKLFADVLRKAQAERAVATVNVICATVEILPTTQIRESMVEVRSVPKELAPGDVFADLEEVVGRVARDRVPKGMPVLGTFLAPIGTPPGLATRIKDGYRAVAVQVDEFAGVAGWIRPGSLVDVAAVMTGSARDTVSKTILEKIEVLAVGQEIVSGSDSNASLARSVTLLVKPDEVPVLHLAATRGRIRLSMRNERDSSVADSGMTTDKHLLDDTAEGRSDSGTKDTFTSNAFLSRLFGNQSKAAPTETDKDFGGIPSGHPQQVGAVPAAPEPRWGVELLHGPKSEQIWFDDSTQDARRIDSAGGGSNLGLRQGSVQHVPASPMPIMAGSLMSSSPMGLPKTGETTE